MKALSKRGWMTLGDLAEVIGIDMYDRPTLSTALHSLRRRGYVARRAAPGGIGIPASPQYEYALVDDIDGRLIAAEEHDLRMRQQNACIARDRRHLRTMAIEEHW